MIKKILVSFDNTQESEPLVTPKTTPETEQNCLIALQALKKELTQFLTELSGSELTDINGNNVLDDQKDPLLDEQIIALTSCINRLDDLLLKAGFENTRVVLLTNTIRNHFKISIRPSYTESFTSWAYKLSDGPELNPSLSISDIKRLINFLFKNVAKGIPINQINLVGANLIEAKNLADYLKTKFKITNCKQVFEEKYNVYSGILNKRLEEIDKLYTFFIQDNKDHSKQIITELDEQKAQLIDFQTIINANYAESIICENVYKSYGSWRNFNEWRDYSIASKNFFVKKEGEFSSLDKESGALIEQHNRSYEQEIALLKTEEQLLNGIFDDTKKALGLAFTADEINSKLPIDSWKLSFDKQALFLLRNELIEKKNLYREKFNSAREMIIQRSNKQYGNIKFAVQNTGLSPDNPFINIINDQQILINQTINEFNKNILLLSNTNNSDSLRKCTNNLTDTLNLLNTQNIHQQANTDHAAVIEHRLKQQSYLTSCAILDAIAEQYKNIIRSLSNKDLNKDEINQLNHIKNTIEQMPQPINSQSVEDTFIESIDMRLSLLKCMYNDLKKNNANYINENLNLLNDGSYGQSCVINFKKHLLNDHMEDYSDHENNRAIQWLRKVILKVIVDFVNNYRDKKIDITPFASLTERKMIALAKSAFVILPDDKIGFFNPSLAQRDSATTDRAKLTNSSVKSMRG